MRDKKAGSKRIRKHALLSTVIVLVLVTTCALISGLSGCKQIASSMSVRGQVLNRASSSGQDIQGVGATESNPKEIQGVTTTQSVATQHNDTLKMLQKTIKVGEEPAPGQPDKRRTYTVKVTYKTDANIPINADLVVEELGAKEEYATALREQLAIQETERMVAAHYLNIAIVADGKEIQPATPVEVVLETKEMNPTFSDAFEAAVLNERETHVAIENLTGKREGIEEEDEHPTTTKLKLTTAKMGKFGIAAVVAPRDTWIVDNEVITIYGARTKSAEVNSVLYDDGSTIDDKLLLRSVTFQTNPTHTWHSALWIDTRFGEGYDASLGGVSCYRWEDDALTQGVFSKSGTSGLVAIDSYGTYAFLLEQGQNAQDAQNEQNAQNVQNQTQEPAQSGVPQDELQNEKDPAATENGQNPDTQKSDATPANDVQTTTTTPTEETPAANTDVQKPVEQQNNHKGTTEVEAADNTPLQPIIRENQFVASDGRTYKVTASFDNSAGIPENAELMVSEVMPSDTEYIELLSLSTKTLGVSIDEVSFAKMLDISFVDPISGTTTQPTENVHITIELLRGALHNSDELGVVHFGEKVETVDATVQGDTVSFDTDGFSVYSLVGIGNTKEYIFWVPKADAEINERITETGYIVENGLDQYERVYVKTDAGNETSSQIVKKGEKPYVPQLNNDGFAGWFQGEPSGTNIALQKSAYDFNNIDFSTSEVVELYARYSNITDVVFYGQCDVELEGFPVTSTKRVELTNNSATVRIDDVVATYSGDQNMLFYGWSETPITVPGSATDDGGLPVSKIPGDTITITSQKSLYPIFKSVNWLSFFSGEEHSGASYVPSTYVFDDGLAGPLTVPARDGYTFLGWFNGYVENGEVIYSTQIAYGEDDGAHESGTLIPGVHGTHVYVEDGKLYLEADVTLYAKWQENTTADYHVVTWTQKASGSGYDFAESYKLTGTIGETVIVGDEYKNKSGGIYAGYTFDHCDDGKVLTGDGKTVLNVYYNGMPQQTSSHTLYYKDSFAESASESLKTESLQCGDPIPTYTPEAGHKGYDFNGWFYDKDCLLPVNMGTATMPNRDMTIYAGWKSVSYPVRIDPNYGAFPNNSTEAMWFNSRIDEEPIQEYLDVTRHYVPSSSGTFFYTKRDLAYYGGNAPAGVSRSDAFYSEDPSQSTEDTTFAYAPNVYSYAGWYEVNDDGTETPYDFSQHVDHATNLKLHWKKEGTYYVSYDSGNGTIGGSKRYDDDTPYDDNASVLVTCNATPPAGYNFAGWRIDGDPSGHVYQLNDSFMLDATYARRSNGHDTVFLKAVYTQVGTVKIVYDANDGGITTDDAEMINYGTPTAPTGQTTYKSIDGAQATISNVANNSRFQLSDGKLTDGSDHYAFYKEDSVLLGWSNKPNYPDDEGSELYALGGEYGVDTDAESSPTTLYAVWGVKVTYHLNVPEGAQSGEYTWGTWNPTGYVYDQSTETYSQNAFLNSALNEPSGTPAYTGTEAKMFYTWTTVKDDPTTAYDYSQPVTEPLDLYACWKDGAFYVNVHAADSSEQNLVVQDEWLALHGSSIPVLSNPVTLDVTTANTYVSNVPADYQYAFAVARNNSNPDLQSVTEADALKTVYYNQSKRQLYVSYENVSKPDMPLNDSQGIYFIYYKSDTLGIAYKNMGSDGWFGTTDVSVTSSAPTTTGAIVDTYSMTTSVGQALNLLSDPQQYSYYSYAIGTKNATKMANLGIMTDAAGADADAPQLQIKNTWRGYQYSVDGGNTWNDYGYDAKLYVVYFDQMPTTIKFSEKTVGTSAVVGTDTNPGTSFSYGILVKQGETTVYDSAASGDTYLLKNGEEHAAIVFFSNEGGTDVTQTITITQQLNDDFTTTNDRGSTQNVWEYTSTAEGGTQAVTFTNTHKSESVEVHAAIVENGSVRLVENAEGSVSVPLGQSVTFTEALDPTTLYNDASGTHTFGGVAYGTESGETVHLDGTDLSAVAYQQQNDNIYELMLKDVKGTDVGQLGSRTVYYLYYTMPKIKYVKSNADGLQVIQGSDGTVVYDDGTLTYNYAKYPEFSMNGTEVKQDQILPVTMSDYLVTQSTSGNFRMPPILDDGTYPRYLSYTAIGVNEGGSTLPTIAGLESDNAVSQDLTLHMRMGENDRLEWSFTGQDDTWRVLSGNTPTVYAIYEERGYDMEITKTVTPDVGDNASFTVTLHSDAIQPGKSYGIEGYSQATITANDQRNIELTVSNGIKYKIAGLGQGTYTVTESNHPNYVLSATTKNINGSDEPVPAEVTNNSFEVELDCEKQVALTNTAKPICKIETTSGELPFYTLQSAVEYIRDNYNPSTNAIAIQMVSDYVMPVTDKPITPYGYNITLKTAPTSGGQYNYEGAGGKTSATITRAADNTTGSMINNYGTLTLQGLTINGNNVAADSAMVQSTGTLNVTKGAQLTGANNTGDEAGNGGAICSTMGTVSISENASIDHNTATSGGAIYATGSAVTIDAVLASNTATNGGAVYYDATGTVAITGNANITNNSASENGGAVYAETGTVAISGGSLMGNTANNGFGGVVYTQNGAVNVSGGTIGAQGEGKANTAKNGSAIFVHSGMATFTGGGVTYNNATEGGAVGIHVNDDGTTAAKLFFSGEPTIRYNTLTGNEDDANVYLNVDSDAVINATGITSTDAYIGIYVPGATTSDLFKHRGEPGAQFGTFTSAANVTAFHNDRLENLTVTSNNITKRLLWGKPLQLQVRYLETFASSFPRKNVTWNGTQKYPATGWVDYYPPAATNAASSIAEDLRTNYTLNLSTTASFAYAFMDDERAEISYEEYLLSIDWDSSQNSWMFTRQDGTQVAGDRLEVYFSEPSYISIENNTKFPLSINDLTIMGHSAVNKTGQAGYGYVYATNGAIHDTLVPIKESDFQLAVGKSVKLLFPGASKSAPYTVQGGFAVTDDTAIPVRQTGQKTITLTGDQRTSFTLSKGQTGANYGSTVDVVFGGDRPICKIVTDRTITSTTGSIATDDTESTGTAYVFAKLRDALTFAQNNGLMDATIQMLVDYLIPANDVLSLPAGYGLTFTTAVGENTYTYSTDVDARATISRNSGNNQSFFTVANGDLTNTSLTIENLIFDGKSFAGSINGGIIKTKDCNVTVTNTGFQNCVAQNGGGMYIDYSPTGAGGTLTVTGSSFTNCESQNGSSRQGGGAIWTTAKVFTLTGSSFDTCTAKDQGGAVFHRIDMLPPVKTQKEPVLDENGDPVLDKNGKPTYRDVPVVDENGNPVYIYTPHAYAQEAETHIINCSFINCEAKAAGGVESDAFLVEIKGENGQRTTFTSCRATARGGGGVNTYIYDIGDKTPMPSEWNTVIEMADCDFTDCTANNTASNAQGGGFRSVAQTTTVTGCRFTNNSSYTQGGAISASNYGARSLTVTDCIITGSESKTGGAIYMDGRSTSNAMLTIEGGSITNNTATDSGGGVYTHSALTLKDATITDNRLTISTVSKAAGVFINEKKLTIAPREGQTTTTVKITGNTVSGGTASNLRMWSGNNANSVSMECNFTEESVIGVINPGGVGTQFGTSSEDYPNPAGYSDTFHVFTADDGSRWGIVDRADTVTTGHKLIWGGPPICKITDANGTLLYLDPAKSYPAVFDRLDNGTTDAADTGAFSVLKYKLSQLQGPNGKLRYKDGSAYSGTYYVKMLVEEYTAGKYITTLEENGTSEKIVLTTEQSLEATEDDPYPYRGTPGSTATIVRGSGVDKNSLMTSKVDLTLTNITLDGGSLRKITSSVNGCIFLLKGSKNPKMTLGPGATLQNGTANANGGGVYIQTGSVVIDRGTIKNCQAKNGGGLYIDSGSSTALTLSDGTISNCRTTTGGLGGGVYLNKGTFNMNGGIIQRCGYDTQGENAVTKSGGGVYVANNNGNNTKLNMGNGRITGNRATDNGGGIAVGGVNSRLYFSGKPYVSANTCDKSVAEGNADNVHVQFTDNNNYNKIINAKGITNNAVIGVYVPGTRNDETPTKDTDPYKSHGGRGDPFGTFTSDADVPYLYGFVNDRNGLKGGLIDNQDTSSDKRIYWIEVFSLDISKTVNSYQDMSDQEFTYTVRLTGTADNGTTADAVTTPESEPYTYGSLVFNAGVATQMINANEEIVPITLHDGESVSAERLPAGLNYEVTETLTTDQGKAFFASPSTTFKGYIGENSGNTSNRYTSKVDFTNINPVCKIMDGSGTQLYYRETIQYNWKENGERTTKNQDSYLPAAYVTVDEAFNKIQSGETLYHLQNGEYYEYTDRSNYRIEMLDDAPLHASATVDAGKTITLTTASSSVTPLPYRGTAGRSAIVTRGFEDGSMLTAAGSLVLTNIALDGAREVAEGATAYPNVTSNGSIVNVNANGALTVASGAILRNATTSGNGGAVFVTNGGTMAMTGGEINKNWVTGSGVGAGIYLEQGALMKLSGAVNFGGKGVYDTTGAVNPDTGNIQADGTKRQDIFIAGYEEADGATNATSLVVDGNITAAGEEGSIWVWAEKTPHYKSLEQFAKVGENVLSSSGGVTRDSLSTSLRAFRNARDDSDTGADQLEVTYLYGMLKGSDTQNVYWYGIAGSNRVILRKVAKTSASDEGTPYDALSGARFTVYRGTSVVEIDGKALENLVAGPSGVFWIGDLPYGTYYINETSPNQGWFTTTVDDEGVQVSEFQTTDPR